MAGLDIMGRYGTNYHKDSDTQPIQGTIFGKDVTLYHDEIIKLGGIYTFNSGNLGYDEKISYVFNNIEPLEFFNMVARFRNPTLTNIQLVQKNTEELEKLQYQICPGKYFLQVMREEFPNVSLFDIIKSALAN